MLALRAKDIMTREIVTIRKGASIEEALRLMAENHVSGLPVVDADGCIEGIITESDVLLKGQVRVAPPSVDLLSRQAVPDEIVEDMYRRARGHRVEDAMTRRVITFSEDSAVTDIARVMIEQNINRVPILHDCHVVGIVSRRDIVRAMAAAVNNPAPTDGEEPRVIELT